MVVSAAIVFVLVIVMVTGAGPQSNVTRDRRPAPHRARPPCSSPACRSPTTRASQSALRIAQSSVSTQVAVVALLGRRRRCRRHRSCSRWCSPSRWIAVAVVALLAGGRGCRCRSRCSVQSRVAAVAVGEVAVVALLAQAGCTIAVAAELAPGRWRRSRRRQSMLPSSHCSPAVDDAVAAAGRPAVRVAAVAVDDVAVVALLAAAGCVDAVAAELGAGRSALQPSPGHRVAVVALLACS